MKKNIIFFLKILISFIFIFIIYTIILAYSPQIESNDFAKEKDLNYLFIENFTQSLEYNSAYNKLKDNFLNSVTNINKIDYNKKIENTINLFYKDIDFKNILI